MRRSPEQERSRKSLKEIRDAARKLIGLHGTDGFSMTLLAKQAKLSKPALYRYFPNKKAILVELAREIFEENRQLIVEQLGLTLPGNEKAALIATFTAYCEVHVGQPYRRHLRAAMAADPELVSLDLADSERNAQIAVGVFERLFPQAPASKLHHRLLILMNQMEPFAKLVASRPRTEWNELIETYVEMCLASLQSP